MAAAAANNLEDVEALLEEGADVNMMDRNARTALMHACGWTTTNAAIAGALIEAGADVNKADRDITALTFVCTDGSMACLRLLIDAGVRVGNEFVVACQRRQDEVALALLEAGADIDMAGQYKRTGLLEACAADPPHEELALALIKKGADVNKCDVWKDDALFYACKRALGNVVRALIDAGSDINKVGTDGASMGCTATPMRCVQLARRDGHEGILRILLDSGADVGTLCALLKCRRARKAELVIAGQLVARSCAPAQEGAFLSIWNDVIMCLLHASVMQDLAAGQLANDSDPRLGVRGAPAETAAPAAPPPAPARAAASRGRGRGRVRKGGRRGR